MASGTGEYYENYPVCMLLFFIYVMLAYRQVTYMSFAAAIQEPGYKDWEGSIFLFDELIDSISRRV